MLPPGLWSSLIIGLGVGVVAGTVLQFAARTALELVEARRQLKQWKEDKKAYEKWKKHTEQELEALEEQGNESDAEEYRYETNRKCYDEHVRSDVWE